MTTNANRSQKSKQRAIDALRRIFEGSGHLVVEPAEYRNFSDDGEDLYIGLIDRERIGVVVAITLRSGRTHRRKGGYGVLQNGRAVRWRERRTPIFGVIYDADDGRLYWNNVTEQLRLQEALRVSEVRISRDNVLTTESVPELMDSAVLSIDHDFPGSWATKMAGSFETAIASGEPIFFHGDPNPIVNFYYRNARQINRIGRWLWPIAMIALMIAELPAQLDFAAKYTPSPPYQWVILTYGVVVWCMALSYSPRFRERIPFASAHLLGVVVFGFLWTPVMLSNGEEGMWPGRLWAFVTYMIIPVVSVIALLNHVAPDGWFVRRAEKDSSP